MDGQTFRNKFRQLIMNDTEIEYVISKMEKIDLEIKEGERNQFTPTLSVLRWINLKWPIR